MTPSVYNGMAVVWPLVAAFARKHPWLAAANLAFMAFVPVNEVLLPHLYGRLVDAITSHKPYERALVAVIGVLVVGQAGMLLRDWVDAWTEPMLEGFIRDRLLSSVIESHDGRLLQDQRTGEMIGKFVRAPSIATTWVRRIIDYIVPYAVVTLVTSLYCWWQDAFLAVSFLALTCSLAMVLYWSWRRCTAPTMNHEVLFDSVYERVEEALRNLPSIYSGNEQERELRELREANEAYRVAYARTMWCAMTAEAAGYAAVVVFFAAFAMRSCRLVSTRAMPVTTFVSLFMVISYLLSSLTWVVSTVRDIIFDTHTLNDAGRIMSPPGPGPGPCPLAPPSSSPGPPPHASGIGMHGVSYSPPGRRTGLLTQASLHFEAGQRTALVGPIGAGKSTILKLFMRFVEPDEGALYIAGRWYKDITKHELRQRVVYVSQDTVLFNRSVMDNVLYGNPSADAGAAERLLADTGIADEFASLPHGLHSKVGKNGSRLSGGQRQLVWFVRAILRDPEVLLLDEPTTSMDHRTKTLVVRLLDVVMQGRTVVIVTHDPFLAACATRQVFVSYSRGTAVREGTHTRSVI